MSKSDLVQFEGEIAQVCPKGIYKILLENNKVEISAKLCGKMRRYNIQVVVGDKVTVGFSPHDLTNGLIIYRHK
ncbi:MAG: translation initiation factor IF-1 [Bdellovibrionales bacterium]|nr:translation initiation factor IF-1 [Bdellovibrionales bacterium]